MPGIWYFPDHPEHIGRPQYFYDFGGLVNGVNGNDDALEVDYASNTSAAGARP